MLFDIAFKLDALAITKMGVINPVKDQLREYFRHKSYGKDIQQYLILLICVGKQFQLLSVNKPRYIDHKESTNRFTGLPMEMNKVWMVDVKFEGDEYDLFVQPDNKETLKILKSKIVSSLTFLNNLPRKIKDFDKELFKIDLLSFFEKDN